MNRRGIKFWGRMRQEVCVCVCEHHHMAHLPGPRVWKDQTSVSHSCHYWNTTIIAFGKQACEGQNCIFFFFARDLEVKPIALWWFPIKTKGQNQSNYRERARKKCKKSCILFHLLVLFFILCLSVLVSLYHYQYQNCHQLAVPPKCLADSSPCRQLSSMTLHYLCACRVPYGAVSKLRKDDWFPEPKLPQDCQHPITTQQVPCIWWDRKICFWVDLLFQWGVIVFKDLVICLLCAWKDLTHTKLWSCLYPDASHDCFVFSRSLLNQRRSEWKHYEYTLHKIWALQCLAVLTLLCVSVFLVAHRIWIQMRMIS